MNAHIVKKTSQIITTSKCCVFPPPLLPLRPASHHEPHPLLSDTLASFQSALASLENVTVAPSVDTLIRISLQCRKLKVAEYADQLYLNVCKHRLESHCELGNYLVPMLVDCGNMDVAVAAFNRLSLRKEHSWTSLIHGCIQSGNPYEAFSIFNRMQEDYIYPSKFTLTALLKACAQLKMIVEGQALHSNLVKKGMEKEIFLGSTVIDLYSKCGLLEEACSAFHHLPFQNSVSWSTWIFGLIEHGLEREGLNQFQKMQREGVRPDAIAYVCSFKACGRIKDMDTGQQLHLLVVKEGYCKDLSLQKSLLCMYADCGLLAEAQNMFDGLLIRDLTSWTGLIRGYINHGYNEEALYCLHKMKSDDTVADIYSLIFCLKACGTLGAMTGGREIHSEILKRGLDEDTLYLPDTNAYHCVDVPEQTSEDNDLMLTTSLIDMYSKCGNMEDSQKVFNFIRKRDLVVWTAFIAGYAFYGASEFVLHYFERMQIEGIQPDEVVFLSVLVVCTHNGHIEKSQHYFGSMVMECDITPSIEHFNCIIDLLGRAGQLIEAVDVLAKIPVEPDFVTWNSILSACRSQGNIELARFLFQGIIKFDQDHIGAHVLMANIYMNSFIHWNEQVMNSESFLNV